MELLGQPLWIVCHLTITTLTPELPLLALFRGPDTELINYEGANGKKAPEIGG